MTWNRKLSLLVALAYIILAWYMGSGRAAFQMGLFSILPLACIWFSEAMGGYTGPTLRGAITNPSAGLMVCIAGWLVLLLPAIFLLAAWCLT